MLKGTIWQQVMEAILGQFLLNLVFSGTHIFVLGTLRTSSHFMACALIDSWICMRYI